MSNTIAVKMNDKVNYYSFRWSGTQLQACWHGEWHNVARTGKKNKYGDAIFIPATGTTK